MLKFNNLRHFCWWPDDIPTWPCLLWLVWTLRGKGLPEPDSGRVLMSNIAVATTVHSICVSSFPASTC